MTYKEELALGIQITDDLNNLAEERVGEPLFHFEYCTSAMAVTFSGEAVYSDQFDYNELSVPFIMRKAVQHARMLLLAVGTQEERAFIRPLYEATRDMIERWEDDKANE